MAHKNSLKQDFPILAEYEHSASNKNPNSWPKTNVRETVGTLTYILHFHRTFGTFTERSGHILYVWRITFVRNPLYDVCSGWGEGGPQKADKRNKIS